MRPWSGARRCARSSIFPTTETHAVHQRSSVIEAALVRAPLRPPTRLGRSGGVDQGRDQSADRVFGSYHVNPQPEVAGRRGRYRADGGDLRPIRQRAGARLSQLGNEIAYRAARREGEDVDAASSWSRVSEEGWGRTVS